MTNTLTSDEKKSISSSCGTLTEHRFNQQARALQQNLADWLAWKGIVSGAICEINGERFRYTRFNMYLVTDFYGELGGYFCLIGVPLKGPKRRFPWMSSRPAEPIEFSWGDSHVKVVEPAARLGGEVT